MAAETAPAPGDTIGVHVVVAGETLEKVTEKYLGDRDLWRENWALNPQVKDPDVLSIGQHLRVITKRARPARSAEVVRVERRVEARPDPGAWSPATVGERLKERDGVRTYQKSSAELSFDDGSNLVLTEDSVVFLKEVGASVRGVKREAIEIVEGQADISARPAKTRASDIEIRIGEAVAKPHAEPRGTSQTRARRRSEGGADLMVFQGTSDVEAGGGRVTVKGGQGTRVPEKGMPLPPERLLAAPKLLAPSRGTTAAFGNPRFSWASVPGAAAYVVEVCRDAGCANLVDRATALRAPGWTPEGLPAGELFWRATAVSPAGLDGFPSEAIPFSVRSSGTDREPPVVVAWGVGPSRVTADGLALGEGGRIQLAAHDDASGVAEIRYRWDGGPWIVHDGAPFSPPGGSKGRNLEFSATDHAGRIAEVQSLRIDSPPAPDPPSVSSSR